MLLGPYPTEMFQRPPANLATFEHLDSKLSGNRGKFPGEQRITLACYGCNQNRNVAEMREHQKRLRVIRRRKRAADKAVRYARQVAWDARSWYAKLWLTITGRGCK